jgi:phosphoribosylanthranilate isomerase
MTRIKFCGIRRAEDIQLANQFRPDYIGLIFAPSKRQVTPELARQLVQQLDAGIAPVGVFVNEEPARIVEITAIVGLAAVQLHGSEGSAQWSELRSLLPPSVAIWQKLSIPVDRAEAAQQVAELEHEIARIGPGSLQPDVWLLDTEVGGQTGGTGITFPWDLLTDFATRNTVACAGGLNPDNVAAAIQILYPAIVDCSSGIERNLVKQADLMDAFCRNVRQIERT